MKKLLATLTFIFSFSFLFAETFEFEPVFQDIFTAREIGIGTNYVSDTSSTFSFLENPANSGLVGNRKIFPFISSNMKGDLVSLSNLAKLSKSGSNDEIAKYLHEMKDTDAKIAMTGPICFGGVINNFAWGIFNSSYATGDIYGEKPSNIISGEQLLVNFGYGFPIKFGTSAIAIGLSIKGMLDVQGKFNGALFDAMTNFRDNNTDFFPMYTTAAFAMDAGVTFSICDIGIISVAWNNFFGASVTAKYDSMSNFKTFNSGYENAVKMPLKSNLKGAVTIKIPLEKCTKGFLTKTNIYGQYGDIITVCQSAMNGTKYNYLEPLAVGLEIEMFHTIVLRYGVNNSYMGGGIGLNLEMIHLDVALYTEKAGFTPNANGTMGVSLSFGVYK